MPAVPRPSQVQVFTALAIVVALLPLSGADGAAVSPPGSAVDTRIQTPRSATATRQTEMHPAMAGRIRVIESRRAQQSSAAPAPRDRAVSRSAALPARPVPTTTRSLDDPAMLDLAFKLLASAEISSLEWRAQFPYIEYNVEGNAAENRGYTAGLVGFTSRTHDMLVLVRRYVQEVPNNPLTPYLPALEAVDGTSSTAGLGPGFVAAWHRAGVDGAFQRVQLEVATEMYVAPAIRQAKADGLGTLGQFIYLDAIVMHGPGSDWLSFGGIRAAALRAAVPPSKGGDERRYLHAFLDKRVAAMQAEEGHSDVSRVEQAQRLFLNAGNLTLTPPLRWTVYGDRYDVGSLDTRCDSLLGCAPKRSGNRFGG